MLLRELGEYRKESSISLGGAQNRFARVSSFHFCFRLKVRPAMVIVPLRAAPLLFCCTV